MAGLVGDAFLSTWEQKGGQYAIEIEIASLVQGVSRSLPALISLADKGLVRTTT